MLLNGGYIAISLHDQVNKFKYQVTSYTVAYMLVYDDQGHKIFSLDKTTFIICMQNASCILRNILLGSNLSYLTLQIFLTCFCLFFLFCDIKYFILLRFLQPYFKVSLE